MKRIWVVLTIFLLAQAGFMIRSELLNARHAEEIGKLAGRLLTAKHMDEPYIAARLHAVLYSMKLPHAHDAGVWEYDRTMANNLAGELSRLIIYSSAPPFPSDITDADNILLMKALYGNRTPANPRTALQRLAERYDIGYDTLLRVYHQLVILHNRAIQRNLVLIEKKEWECPEFVPVPNPLEYQPDLRIIS